MYTISNIYVLAAFGTIGGALFGFDISSMSAWIDQKQYLEYFNYPNSNLQGGVSSYLYMTQSHICTDNSRLLLPCQLDLSWAPSQLELSVILSVVVNL
jgi:hypothetical protein